MTLILRWWPGWATSVVSSPPMSQVTIMMCQQVTYLATITMLQNALLPWSGPSPSLWLPSQNMTDLGSMISARPGPDHARVDEKPFCRTFNICLLLCWEYNCCVGREEQMSDVFVTIVFVWDLGEDYRIHGVQNHWIPSNCQQSSIEYSD